MRLAASAVGARRNGRDVGREKRVTATGAPRPLPQAEALPAESSPLLPGVRSQPQTWAIHFAIGVRRLADFRTNRCRRRSRGYGRALASRVRLRERARRQRQSVDGASNQDAANDADAPECDNLLDALAPLDRVVVLEPRRVLVDDKVEQVKLADDWRLAFGREGEPVLGDLEEREAEGPDVRLDRVLLAEDPFRLGVGRASAIRERRAIRQADD